MIGSVAKPSSPGSAVPQNSASTRSLELVETASARSEFFEQPVPRRFVHRASVAEVLITGFAADDRPNTFLLAAQWPRGHSYYGTSFGVHDPLLFAETVRQAGLMVGHAGYSIPLDHAFVMRQMAYEIGPAGLLCEGAPTNIILAVNCYDLRYRKDQLQGYRYVVELRRGLETVGVGSSETLCVTPATYRRLRGGAGVAPVVTPTRLPEPVSPALVGKKIRADVVLTPTDTENTWLLRCDPTHPVLFDHPVDHVPGMVIIEAMRQAAHCALYPGRSTMIRFSTNFERYAELSEPTLVRAFPDGTEADGSVRVRVELTQGGETIATGWCTCQSSVGWSTCQTMG
jgi:2-oxo-3-(phosphooxy)propyl 3-oxoalkanoate synthase